MRAWFRTCMAGTAAGGTVGGRAINGVTVISVPATTMMTTTLVDTTLVRLSASDSMILTTTATTVATSTRRNITKRVGKRAGITNRKGGHGPPFLTNTSVENLRQASCLRLAQGGWSHLD